MKVVLFHANCQDGLFAAATLYEHFEKDALYIPVNYKPIQDLSPQEALEYLFHADHAQELFDHHNSFHKLTDVQPSMYKDIELYIVDYSLPISHFLHCASLFKSVLCLDHHASAAKQYMARFQPQEDFNGWIVMRPTENSKLVFSEKDSGAKLAHRYFNKDQEVPHCIELVSDRDLWQFKQPNTNLFHYGFRLLNEANLHKVITYARTNFDFILTLGKLQEKEIQRRVKSISKHGAVPLYLELDGRPLQAGLVNSAMDITSDIGHATLQSGCDVAIIYSIYSLSNVSFSLRSAPGVDVSGLAVKHGGGGHPNACNFHADFKFLVNLLTTGVWLVNT